MLYRHPGMARDLEARTELRTAGDVAVDGSLRDQWLGRKISLARTLTALLPLLVFVYSIFASVMSWLGYESIYGRDQLWSQEALLVFTRLLMSAGGLVIWAAYRDLESTNAQLSEVSFKDEVTHLYNRRFFAIRLEAAIARYRRFNHPVSLVLLDLDGFKSINDQFGHRAGDDTLRGVADLLLMHSRGINIICRYGGDEFAILLVETAKEGAQVYADRIRHVLAQHDFPHGSLLSASLGVASLPEDVGASADALLHAADEALYASKRGGKNRVSTHRPAVPVASETPVLLHAISGGSDAPLSGLPESGVGLEALMGTRPADERSVLVLDGDIDVRLALEGLSDAAYDLILRPAPSGARSGRMTGDVRPRSEIRRHGGALRARARLCARAGPRPRHDRGGDARHRAWRRPARYRQDRHSRLDSAQAGPPHSRRVEGDADASRSGSPARRAHSLPGRSGAHRLSSS